MGWGPDGWNITNELVKISVRMQLKWCLYTQHSKHCSSSAHVIITAPDVHMPSTKPRTEYMQSLWEGSLEDFFIHRGTQKEKHWQERGPAFFFTTSTRKHDELVLPGSPTRRASLSCTDPPEDKTLWQPQAKQLGWDLPLLASVMSGRLQTLNSESSSLRDFFFFFLIHSSPQPHISYRKQRWEKSVKTDPTEQLWSQILPWEGAWVFFLIKKEPAVWQI